MKPVSLTLLACFLLRPACGYPLHYFNITHPKALCNDFSKAGMFVESSEGRTTKKWIIFMESGGLCSSPASCNSRFFHPSLRSSAPGSIAPNSFDAAAVWAKNKGRDLSEVISPLMTSVYRFRGTNLFPKPGGQFFVIFGRDILSDNCEENPVFCNHNRVVLPYCSSDLWLGNDTRAIGKVSITNRPSFLICDYTIIIAQ